MRLWDGVQDARALLREGVEVWASAPGTTYLVSSRGAVFNVKTGRSVATSVNTQGYVTARQWLVHRLVCAAFDGPRPSSVVVHHLDHDRSNNALTNLGYMTRSDHVQEGIQSGRLRHRSGTLTPLPSDADAVVAAFVQGSLSEREALSLLGRSSAWLSARARAVRAALSGVVEDVPLSPTQRAVAREAAARGEETWRSWPGKREYQISSLGRVRNTEDGVLREIRKTPDDYARFLGVMLHPVVMQVFGEERPSSEHVVRHYPDPDKHNCQITNLRWGTQAENMQDAREHGNLRSGGVHHNTVLTDADVAWALDCYVRVSLTNEQFGKLLGVTQATAAAILSGAAWAHVPRPPGFAPRGRRGGAHHLSRLTDEIVSDALQKFYENGWTTVRLGQHLGVSQGTAHQIASGKTWRHLPRPWATKASGVTATSPVLPRGSVTVIDLVERLLSRAAEPAVLADGEPVITREEILRATHGGKDDPAAPALVDAAMTFFRAYVEKHGWFYPRSDVRLDYVLRGLSRTEPAGQAIQGTTSDGTDYLRGRFRSYWDVDNGPAAAFQRDALLRSVLRYRLGFNGSKLYTYTVDGAVVQRHETFDINISNVRRGFVVQRHAVSFFKPSAAAAVYQRYVGGRQAPVVWDPSCGFGARLLAFAAVCPTGTYYGNEPASAIRRDVAALAQDVPCRAVIDPRGSEFASFDEESLDLVFTSPPYFDLERYYDEPGQCWRDYPTVDLWEQQYLLPTLRAARGGVKRDGRVVINVDEARRAVVCAAASRAGLRQVDEHTLILGVDHFQRKGGRSTARTEPLLVFART